VIAHQQIIATRASTSRCTIPHARAISRNRRRAVKRFVEEDRLPHLLFYGPPGTGKTTTILALAKSLYGKNYGQMVLEVGAIERLLKRGLFAL
jgi:DNA replication protein DnaC